MHVVLIFSHESWRDESAVPIPYGSSFAGRWHGKLLVLSRTGFAMGISASRVTTS